MKRLAVYLKPHVVGLIFCITILFVQAMGNLYLPNYMAKIVDVGIQQGGIEEVSPKAISQKGYSFINIFMSDAGKKTMSESYTLVGSGSEPAKTYEEKYPALKTSSIYIQKSLDEEQQKNMDDAFCKGIMAFIYLSQDYSNNKGLGESTNSSSRINEINLDEIYKMISVFQSTGTAGLEKAKAEAQKINPSDMASLGSTMNKLFYNDLGEDTSKIQSGYILKIGAVMLAITLVSATSGIIAGLLAARISAAFARDARRDLFAKVQNFSQAEFDKFSTASLITRTTNDITQIQSFMLMGIRIMFYAPMMGIGGIILALRESLSMSWIIFLGVLVLVLIMYTIFKITMPKFKILQKLTDKVNLITRENLSGIMVIRAFGNQQHEENRFDKANKDLTRVNLFINKVMVFMFPAMMLFMNLICVLIIWVGGHEIEKSTFEIGNMIAFMQYAMLIIMAFLMISVMFIMVPRASVSADRIADVLETKVSVLDKKENELKHIPKDQKASVKFKDVCFRFGNALENVLEDINFEAKAGETTAIIGSTGSGKSVLINLIPKFYDVTSGVVSVGGIDIRDISKRELRDHIGFVPQKGILFSGTIKSNLHYGDEEVSDEQLKEAAKIAQSLDFIETREDKFKSSIAQGGNNVSGGQKQRLCIARALVKKAPVYIFDDSFSALDFKTDAKLRQALKDYTKDSVVIIVAQRISTIMNAEQIIVLDEGRIVGKGRHKELLKNCKTYADIAVSQLSEEDLKL